MYIASPLDQFEIIRLIPLTIGGIDFSVTQSGFFIGILLSFGFYRIWKNFQSGLRLVPTNEQYCVEQLYQFVLNLLSQQVDAKGLRLFFPLVLTLFTLLIFSNLGGMIPYSFTVTSHFSVTLGLAFSLFIGLTIFGFVFHGLHFFALLLPKGAPLILAPFLVVLELISYTFRPLSLGIRLGANMMAGHTLVKIIAGFSWEMLYSSGIICQLSVVPFIAVIILTGMEIAIAIIQAYVFSMLISLYLKDALELH